MTIHAFPLTLMLATAAGCGSGTSYVYAPQNASYVSDGYPTTSVAVPPEKPEGKAELTSFGITEIKPDGSGPIAALHVRLAISNDGDATPWTLATSDQLVEIAGEGRSRPIYVNTDVQTLPTVTIAPRERRVLDLYYPLPANIHDDDHLPQFDFLWQVTTPARPFASRTHFQRMEQELPVGPTEVVLWSGWGPYWWYDPFYPEVMFLHHRPLFAHRSPHVIVTHAPHRHYRAVREHRH
jgi:hypothetical protein